LDNAYLGVPQQFDNTTLVGSETGALANDVADEFSALGEVALGSAHARLGCAWGDFLCLWLLLVSSVLCRFSASAFVIEEEEE